MRPHHYRSIPSIDTRVHTSRLQMMLQCSVVGMIRRHGNGDVVRAEDGTGIDAGVEGALDEVRSDEAMGRGDDGGVVGVVDAEDAGDGTGDDGGSGASEHGDVIDGS
eukprot:gb/GECH01013547.1/.p1 GENE.gb/GECH01013547.1/~~gb/GECH01013547.1/.p1  ORF type:complete len:107 (+),score=21.91 gb/GECH01013547.1/:1-321(+)